MKVLITTGGTIVPIDPVRYIANWSRGNFGTKIAREFLKRGHYVLQLRAAHSAHPFHMVVDGDTLQIDVDKHRKFCDEYKNNYDSVEFQTHTDYEFLVQEYIKRYQPDVILLAAAVSDYTTIPSDDKIRSSEDLTIKLTPFTKIISLVRNLCGQSCTLVGFKLLVGVSDQELINSAKDSIEKNNCDIVLANEFNRLKSGNHKIICVSRTTTKYFDHTPTIPLLVTKEIEEFHEHSVSCNR